MATRIKTAEPRECPICFHEFELSDTNIAITKVCRHIFHNHCIIEWSNKNDTCPLCRGEGLRAELVQFTNFKEQYQKYLTGKIKWKELCATEGAPPLSTNSNSGSARRGPNRQLLKLYLCCFAVGLIYLVYRKVSNKAEPPPPVETPPSSGLLPLHQLA